jgi:pimeloyl-ACP methyl ester carboxylesterase
VVVSESVRKYGHGAPCPYARTPYNVVVIHGGPGASGEMAPVARVLARRWGVVEPVQTATSLEGQIEELKRAIEAHADPPVSLIGFSWGAWLGYLLAARHPALARKLILVGSGPYTAAYGAQITEARLSRLEEDERAEMRSILARLADPVEGDTSDAFARLGALASKTDAYDPVDEEEATEDGYGLPRLDRADAARVLAEAQAMRASGALLEAGKNIRCPVVGIHGAEDPHPAEGVREPLSGVVADLSFHLIGRCGHKPWIERQAREEFYCTLESALC